MSDLTNELIENYTGLAASRGWTVEQMADHIETQDRRVAAELRRRAAADGDTAASSEPATPAPPADPKDDDPKDEQKDEQKPKPAPKPRGRRSAPRSTAAGK